MNLPFRIARRYFFSRNKRSFISIIALIAMIGVAVGTMAMVVVLSVFNGMEDLNRQIFKTFDADIKITPTEGRRFEVPDSLLRQIQTTPGVGLVTQVIEDNALARYGDHQTIVRLKGVDSTYQQRGQLNTALIEGSLQLYGPQGTAFAVLSEGVRNALLVSMSDYLTPIELWYPRSDRRTLNFNNPDAFNQIALRPGGTFFIESRYDDYILAPLPAVAELLQFGTQRTSLEVQLAPGAEPEAVQRRLRKVLTDVFTVKNRDELNADLLRAIRVEKLFVTITLSFIILVAAINIFFSLSMLAIEKKSDVAMLYAMGATSRLIRSVFLAEGAIVALTGALVGLAAGVGICWLQQEYGLVSMGMVSSLVDAYPVKLVWTDVAVTGIIIVLITLTVSFLPARRAAEAGRLAHLG
ncbi:FtsX-like permease family protein [Rhabdobacter roseus]|uniref:Lipoprotein-releasing system permease protein n=1 Tax=Rhabdobacter roseus TaxID=1655419 RepID=A0A840TPV3_9BACT|nr:FtsX-like permease family protein [Rhabdobacter roseus]MBB5286366.1 lipoprotein-releasing system permease protein [Rhabdobacter roseus]